MSDCLFCKIIAGEIPSAKVFEDDKTYAFRDINPAAASRCLEVIGDIAKKEGLTNGYRVVSNCGPDACQSVHHLHFHVLGGGQMSEKMS